MYIKLTNSRYSFTKCKNKTNLTALICFQLAIPVSGPFCSLVRPWTVSNLHPASCNIKAYCTDFSMSSNILTLQVIGTDTACDIAFTETK